ncbi:MAG TPA: response regulator transcription factor [Candidatus Omnitrophota bacterium]|jgi:DNA-binding response OmpR family regulator|nr:response regulator transcription factor [Candidatus Omnitrophota bacterium]HQB94698.1 response regulator transcription factor [Candidatus Omnitrophota bacterium]
MADEKILIIEDEKNIVELVKFNLEREGFRVLAASRGNTGLEMAIREKPALLILDLMLPEITGIEICKILRQDPKTKALPIVMLTAKGTEADKVLGLELGADDYITKPFSPRELVARIKSILRRSREKPEAELMSAGSLELDISRHELRLNNKKVEISAKEFQLLRALMGSHGRVLTREVLLEKVWGYDDSTNIETRTVDMHIGQLRKKLGKESGRIVTIKSVGYRFDND